MLFLVRHLRAKRKVETRRLGDAPVWTPVPMRGPEGPTACVEWPAEFLPGIASTGLLPAHMPQ